MKKITLVLFLILEFALHGQTILNAYAKVTSVTNSSVLALSNVNIANHSFTVGGMVVIMQMQDNVIGTNTVNNSSFGNLSSIANAGVYEIRTIAAISPTSGTPTSVTITPALSNTFNTGANSSVQMISFRDLGANYTTTANIGGLTWDGNVGGLVAFYVTNTLTLNHRVLADGLGFRGGLYSNNNGGPVCAAGNNTVYTANNNNLGFKGEGIYKNTTNTYNNARGKILNGGGGGVDHNAGGGGGGNFTAGGQGGNGYNNCTTYPGGGLGGLSLSGQISASRVFMGGGGGGGQQNNSQNSSGANGGGIILIKANTIQTSTTCGASIRISANGSNAISGGNDGMGGGGAAGSIVIEASTISINASCPILIRANGGDGGDCNDGAAHAGGGGGGQGVVIYSNAQPTVNTTTQTNNGAPGQDNSGGAFSATSGSGSNGSGVISSSSGPLPITLLNFYAQAQNKRVLLKWKTATETNNDYFTIERSANGAEYVVISEIKAAGNSRTPKSYEAYDNNPLVGINYYRLKQTDITGEFSYSSILSFDFNNYQHYSIFPNPILKDQALHFTLSDNSSFTELKIIILSLTGTEVLSYTLRRDSDDQEDFVIPKLELKPGIYLLKIGSGYTSEIKKLVVE